MTKVLSCQALKALLIGDFRTPPLKPLIYAICLNPVAILKILYSSLKIIRLNYEPIAKSPFLFKELKE